ncbi:hypothetical protein ACF09J_06590 [Streptomyces sp. NPDC014889]|uniref:hypothetical protein n=1 Tax=Streptomyces sp. NPDC014889 TaxID=3364928 RepID=UPI0037002B48
MLPEIHLALHRTRAAELQAEAHRPATPADTPGALRTRLGWTLVELGLRLATGPRAAAAL